MTKRTVKIGSRDSALAMWQTKHVISELEKVTSAYTFEIVPLKTKGDKILDVSLAKVGDKGLFTKELEAAMLDKTTDLAVHSMKDVPTNLVDGLIIGSILKREDPRDVLISPKGYTFQTLPEGAKVGTSSLRRKAQLQNLRPDLKICDVRGNLNTRMRKMHEENFDALILAAAGVIRMGWSDEISEYLPMDIFLAAVSQGAIGIECREDDAEIMALIAKINDGETATCVCAERALLRALEGGCQIPIAAHAVIKNDTLKLNGLVASLDGKRVIKETLSGNKDNAEEIGLELAKKLTALGADEILAEIRQELTI
ncbi:MAG: hydroxymethylbilane synthase [Clostridiales bacterium]|nr:MAG: hydroxymethylbilane synthase [Clostridiales bacterium]